ncbi:hypothetical protein PoB_001716300 [Plakobranchus ocellatus]|uniref:Uncharacterized protein n=1 Tax=Plakobranchus ocellatus TaxID=259542 RepID=A0AAV3Z7Q0_9GAST|nr:hypothetical protein PoB_001716300 [Plakobranchus ocellatus]
MCNSGADMLICPLGTNLPHEKEMTRSFSFSKPAQKKKKKPRSAGESILFPGPDFRHGHDPCAESMPKTTVPCGGRTLSDWSPPESVMMGNRVLFEGLYPRKTLESTWRPPETLWSLYSGRQSHSRVCLAAAKTTLVSVWRRRIDLSRLAWAELTPHRL